MRQLVALSVAAGLMLSAGAALADAEMVKKYNCLACHANDRQVLGPAFKAVAEKYAGDKTAADRLAKKIKAGGSGVWGQMPMPPHPQIPDADALAISKYVLSIK